MGQLNITSGLRGDQGGNNQNPLPFVLSSPARTLQPPAAAELDASFGLPARAPGVGEAPRPDPRGRPRKLRRQEERVSCHRALTAVRSHQVRWVPRSVPPMGSLAGWRCGTLSSPSLLALETPV